MSGKGSWSIFLGFILGSIGAFLLSQYGKNLFFSTFGIFALTVFTFSVQDRILPLLLIVFLALGSWYNTDVAQKTYWARFVLLGLIGLRSFLFFLRESSSSLSPESKKINFFHLSLIFICSLGLLSCLYSVSPFHTFQRSFSFFLLWSVLFFFFWSQMDQKEKVQEFLQSMWFTIPTILGVGFIFFVFNRGSMFSAGRLRLVFGNPNQLGHYCALFAPIAVFFLLEKSEKKIHKLAWISIGFLSLALVWSGSRAALLSTAVSLFFLFFICYPRKLIFLGLLLGFVGSMNLLMGEKAYRPDQDPSFFEKTVMRPDVFSSGSGRTEVWKAGITLINKRPLLGYGFGSVENLFRMGYFPSFFLFQGGHVHNSYLEEVLNLGWLGSFPLFLCVLYLLAMGVIHLRIPREKTQTYKLACSLFAMVLAGLISGIFESWFTSVGSIFCFPFWFSAMTFLKIVNNFKDWNEAVKPI